MRLPRRVPWASITELDQVCAWIYTDDTDIEAQKRALARISAWRAITTLPYALESTLAILSVIIQDSSHQGSSYLSLRQSYAAALIRMVNGLVDPLQVGTYARSIASIASQLGLPAWLVELRHAATHEDLPSVELLREAARESMSWLLNNYFLPALNPSAPPSRTTELRSVAPLMAEYKSLMKTVTRDASLRNQYKAETTKILRELERWTAEAKIAADVSAVTVEWDDIGGGGGDTVEEGGRERWALDRLCDALLEKGGLVPLSKRKRVVTSTALYPPQGTLAIWSPLLAHLSTLHHILPAVLISRIVTQITSSPEATISSTDENISLDQVEPRQDILYEICLASWANWLVGTFIDKREDDDDEGWTRDDVVVALLTAMGPGRSANTNDKAARLLLKSLCVDRPHLLEAISLVPPPAAHPIAKWTDQDLQTMSERLSTIMARPSSSHPTTSGSDLSSSIRSPPVPTSSEERTPDLPSGWRVLGAQDGWRPAPIGVFVEQ